MGILTDLTRMWLTRSVKKFTFKSEYDSELAYTDCERLGLYVHIPFCQKICNFCPYCKTVYEEKTCESYVQALLEEIRLVGEQAIKKTGRKKETTSLYFGGGTPALVAHRLKEIVDTLREYFVITEGIGVELHPDNVTVETLRLLRESGVTKISIGIQSFQEKYQTVLGREAVDIGKIAETLREVPFETVSMDFIFALPNQTFDDLKYN